MHIRLNVYREGYFPGHFNLKSDLKNIVAFGKTKPRRYLVYGVCYGKIVHKPDQHREKKAFSFIFWQH
jgi:hypothetical protein